MKRTTNIILAFIFTLAVGALLWPTLGSQAQAQTGCKSFQAIFQASLPSSTPISPATDVWGGPLHGMLGGQLFMGVVAGNDGQDTWHRSIGIGKGGAYTVCADYPTCNNKFTYEVPNAVFPFKINGVAIGHYSGNTARIASGTGIFQGASGYLNVSGPFVAWLDPNSPFGESGRWNGEISGNVCGIQ